MHCTFSFRPHRITVDVSDETALTTQTCILFAPQSEDGYALRLEVGSPIGDREVLIEAMYRTSSQVSALLLLEPEVRRWIGTLNVGPEVLQAYILLRDAFLRDAK